MTEGNATLLSLKGLTGPIELGTGLEEIAEMLRDVLSGWPLRQGVDDREPILRLRRRRGDIRVERTGERWSAVEPTSVSAVCTLIVEIVANFVSAKGGFGALHAAAADYGGRLVLFPATHRAGKSTLMAHLSAGGRRVFADDLMPIDLESGEGVASGALTRLRLPLPALPASELLHSFVESRTVMSDGSYAYVAPEPPLRVLHGERLPIGAIVVLERCEDPGSARIEPIPTEDALLRLLVQNTHEDLDAEHALLSYLSIVSEAPAFRLIHATPQEAAELLDATFGDWSALRPVIASTETRPLNGPRDRPDEGAPQGEPLYRRNPMICLRVVGEAAFLADPIRNDIHRLDGLGTGLWNLVAEPTSREAIVSVFAGAFPEIPHESIERDIGSLLERMLDKGLVLPAIHEATRPAQAASSRSLATAR